MRLHRVVPNDFITAINGQPVLGFDTGVIATALQGLPACVTLRLLKNADYYIPEVFETQVKPSRCGGVAECLGVNAGIFYPCLYRASLRIPARRTGNLNYCES